MFLPFLAALTSLSRATGFLRDSFSIAFGFLHSALVLSSGSKTFANRSP
jgi:hypothetical protein